MIYLSSDLLRVEICEPNEAPNNTFRFDRAGFVSEIILDGHMRFCASEPNNLWHPSSGGRGLCSEIVFDPSNQFHVGESFPKLGVGLLKKTTDEPYCFYKRYDAEWFPIEVNANPTFVEFQTKSLSSRGIAVEQHKRVEVKGNRLALSMQITNIGEQTLQLREYCHNFISIGGMSIGDAYHLDLPSVKNISQGPLASSEGRDNYAGAETGLYILGHSDQYATIKFGREHFLSELPFKWTLRNSAAKARVTCEESFLPADMAVWCVDHMVSPEVFHTFTLNPNEVEEWQRTYLFELER